MSRLNIVVVEDNPGEVEILRHTLDQLSGDYELTVLHDGADGLKFVEDVREVTRETHPCVVLLDINLPKHDGLEVLRAIRNEKSLDHIPVIMVAGMITPEQRRQIVQMAATYHPKPSDLKGYRELGTLIVDLCGTTAVAA